MDSAEGISAISSVSDSSSPSPLDPSANADVGTTALRTGELLIVEPGREQREYAIAHADTNA